MELTHFQAALRRLLPGRRHAYLRRSARGLADHYARTGCWGPRRIIAQLRQWYGDRISDSVLRGLREALDRDIPGGPAMRVQVRDWMTEATVICEVEASGKTDDEERAEENIVLALDMVKPCFLSLSHLERYQDWAPQPRLLLAIRLLVEAQNQGLRDEERERQVFAHFVALHGVRELSTLLDVDQERPVAPAHT